MVRLPKAYRALTFAAISVAFVTGCGDIQDPLDSVLDSPSFMAESASATAGSIASDTENGTLGTSSVGGAQISSVGDTVAAEDYHELGTCSLSTARSSCSGATITTNWNGCTISIPSGSATLTGGWTQVYDSAATCTAALSGPLNTSGQSVTRTATTPFVVTLPGSPTLSIDTNAQTAYDGTSIPNTGVVTTVTASTGYARTIVINGMHRVLRSPHGTTWFDHSITSTGVAVSGTRAAGNRVVTGTIKLYHNLIKVTATNTLNSVTWGQATCPFPTSGSISTTLTGAQTGTTTLTFTTTCGTATFVNTSGATSSVSLTQPE